MENEQLLKLIERLQERVTDLEIRLYQQDGRHTPESQAQMQDRFFELARQQRLIQRPPENFRT